MGKFKFVFFFIKHQDPFPSLVFLDNTLGQLIHVRPASGKLDPLFSNRFEIWDCGPIRANSIVNHLRGSCMNVE